MSVESDGARAIALLEGRLDGEWAEHLSDTLTDLLRGGTRSVVLDLSRVEYASSAGTRVLARHGREFAALRGELLLASPSPAVSEVLAVAGLGDRILRSADAANDPRRLTAELNLRSTPTGEWRAPQTPGRHARYEVSPHEPGATLACSLRGRGFQSGECDIVTASERSFGLGVGAIGDSYDDCSPRMGELVSAAGVVAYLPTDGAYVADYRAGSADHAARAVVGSAVVCEGSFAQLARFAMHGETGPVPLSELTEVVLNAVGGDTVGLVMVAETAGLVGAWLRRAPTATGKPPSFEMPSVRSWFSLTAEPSQSATTALVVGVATRTPAPPLASQVRPLDRAGTLHGHFHAVAFSYSPVPQRTMTMPVVVRALFDQERIRALMHLLRDDRPRTGVGESTFLRGLVWAAPVGRISVGDAA